MAVPAQIADLLDFGAREGALSDRDQAYLEANLHRLAAVESIWEAMDAEWDAQGADFKPGNEAAVGAFYGAPVWLLNGLFTETDPESLSHRDAITSHVAALGPGRVADFGGGFGSLSRRLASALPEADVTLVEPYPHPLAAALAEKVANLNIAAELPADCDVVIAEDVLEHVTDPIGMTQTLLEAVKPGGVLITANCFRPVIKCHYPGAFHLHLSYRFVIPPLGCRYAGTVAGAAHAQIFRKTGGKGRLDAARRRERASAAAYPHLTRLRNVKRRLLGRPVLPVAHP